MLAQFFHFLDVSALSAACSPYVGLSPFLRLSIAGEPLQPVAEHLLSVAADEPDNPNVWMNLSLAAQCLGQPETGAAMRDQALALARCYALPALRQPASCRLLLLMAEGDIAENTPIDCLLEQSDVDLVHFYPRDGHLNFADLPEHDILMVAMADSPASRPLLAGLAGALADWPRPVINRPEHVPATERTEASRRLQEVPGIRMPPTRLVGRDALSRIAAGQSAPAMEFPDVGFPFIVRPRGSQAGRDLARVESVPELADYLSAVDALEFFISDYVDYRGADGLFRKMRIALIDGESHALSPQVYQFLTLLEEAAGEPLHKRAIADALEMDIDAFKPATIFKRHKPVYDAFVAGDRNGRYWIKPEFFSATEGR